MNVTKTKNNNNVAKKVVETNKENEMHQRSEKFYK